MSKTKILQKENTEPISNYFLNSKTQEPNTSEQILKKIHKSESKTQRAILNHVLRLIYLEKTWVERVVTDIDFNDWLNSDSPDFVPYYWDYKRIFTFLKTYFANSNVELESLSDKKLLKKPVIVDKVHSIIDSIGQNTLTCLAKMKDDNLAQKILKSCHTNNYKPQRSVLNYIKEHYENSNIPMNETHEIDWANIEQISKASKPTNKSKEKPISTIDKAFLPDNTNRSIADLRASLGDFPIKYEDGKIFVNNIPIIEYSLIDDNINDEFSTLATNLAGKIDELLSNILNNIERHII
ncbi:MAG: hypothetical protein WC155_01895 [Candidatus Cloacimonadales bacterium]